LLAKFGQAQQKQPIFALFPVLNGLFFHTAIVSYSIEDTSST